MVSNAPYLKMLYLVKNTLQEMFLQTVNHICVQDLSRTQPYQSILRWLLLIGDQRHCVQLINQLKGRKSNVKARKEQFDDVNYGIYINLMTTNGSDINNIELTTQ